MQPVKEPNYPIHEVFHTFQGEGLKHGKRAFFIRLFGCPLRCPWCDSAGTWHPEYKPKSIPRKTVPELVAMAKEAGARLVVITGGEPTIHDLLPLVRGLREVADEVAIETSGTFEIPEEVLHTAFITVSPKWARLPLAENLAYASELKLIVEHSRSIEEWMTALHGILKVSDHSNGLIGKTIWLHPEWSQRSNPEVLRSISETIKGSPLDFRAGYQMHKLYQVDFLDSRAQPSAPLGGDPQKGM